MKAQFIHNFVKAHLFNSIIRLIHIKLQCHLTHYTPLPLTNMVHCFKCYQSIISNKSTINKGIL